MIRIDTALIGQEQKQHAGVPPAPTSADQLAAPQLHAYPCHTRPETGSNLPRRFSAFFRLRATSSPLELELEVKLELELETQFRSVDVESISLLEAHHRNSSHQQDTPSPPRHSHLRRHSVAPASAVPTAVYSLIHPSESIVFCP